MNNLILRKGKFDAAHRLLRHASKCRNLHGHEYSYKLVFEWAEAQIEGFAIDFSEIKRTACAWFDQAFDHALIANPQDSECIALCRKEDLQLYEMHLGGPGAFCNPTAENIAKEMFYACEVLLNSANLRILRVELQETSHCSALCLGLGSEERSILDSSALRQALKTFQI